MSEANLVMPQTLAKLQRSDTIHLTTTTDSIYSHVNYLQLCTLLSDRSLRQQAQHTKHRVSEANLVYAAKPCKAAAQRHNQPHPQTDSTYSPVDYLQLCTLLSDRSLRQQAQHTKHRVSEANLVYTANSRKAAAQRHNQPILPPSMNNIERDIATH